jgi:hypothetical protein
VILDQFRRAVFCCCLLLCCCSSRWQLRAWDREGFFAPHVAYEDRHAPYSRICAFQNVVGLRTIAILMNDFRVFFQKLRKVASDCFEVLSEGWWPHSAAALSIVERVIQSRLALGILISPQSIRVSTRQQQRSGLGIEAQRATVRQFAAAERLTIVGEFVEFESGKGADALDRRPQLAAALAAAKASKCS